MEKQKKITKPNPVSFKKIKILLEMSLLVFRQLLTIFRKCRVKDVF